MAHVTVTVCVGSLYHLKGARNVLAAFSQLVKDHAMEDRVALRGSFCLERCGKEVNWMIGGTPITSESVADAVRVFTERVLVPLRRADMRPRS